MQVVQDLKITPESRPKQSRPQGRGLNGRLIVALVLDVVAWALIIGAVWGAMKLLKMA